MFSSFPHRHGDAAGKPATRDKTRGCRKTSISYETSSNFDICDAWSNRLECHKVPRLPRKTTWQLAWTHSKRRGFPASPIDTATPQENQRLETRHVDAEKPAFCTRLPPIFTASPIDTARPRDNQRLETRHVRAPKRAFRARLPPLFTLCSFKIDVFLRVFLRTWKFATSKSIFRARLQFSAHRTKCHDCHGICTLSPLDAALPMRLAKNTQHDTSKVLPAPATKNDDGHVQSAAPATKSATHLLTTLQKYCACHAKRLSTRSRTRLNATKCHACHAKRSNDTSETAKKDHLCKTSHRHGHTGIARMVANGCRRLRPWTQRRANTPSTPGPRPPEWNGNPCYAFGN